MLISPARTRRTLLTGLAFLAAACSSGEGPAAKTQPTDPPDPRLILSVFPKLDTLTVDASRAFAVRITNAAGIPQQVAAEWVSTAPDVATVSQGVVTGIASGASFIVARVGAWADTARVVIVGRPVSLQLSPAAVNVAQGDTINFDAEFVLGDGVTLRASHTSWQSTDSSSGRIVGDGLVEAAGMGDFVITAEAQGMTATATVSVFAATVGSVAIDPSSNTMYAGANKTLEAVVRDQNGRTLRNAAVSWRTANSAIATVNSSGQVSGVATGGTVVTATSGGKSASATVTVVTVPASSASLTLSNDTVLVGHTLQATGKALDSEGRVIPNRPMAYSSSNSLVATVNSSGVVTGRVVGTTNISVLIDGKTATQRIWVVSQVASSISISPSAPSVSVGGKDTLSATVLDQLGQPLSGYTVIWSSGSTSVATISTAGVLTGLAPGQTSITATAAGISASVTATVSTIQVASVRVSPTTASVLNGQSTALVATAYSSTNQLLSGRVFSWKSANPAVASVSASGAVTGVGPGATTITATTSGVSATASVSVTSPPPAPVASVVVALNASQLNVGQTTQASATAFDAGGNVVSGKTFTWASIDPSLVTVSNNGLVTAIATGSATVSATVDGITGLASLTVATQPPAPVASITMTAAATSLTPSVTMPLTVTLFDSLGNVLTGRTISYATSNASVASVSAVGVVTALTVGTSTVTATSGGKSASLAFTVSSTPPPPPKVYTVTVTANASALTVGQTTQATAVAKDSLGNVLSGQTLTWTTSSAATASVNSSGLITAVGAGAASISATAGGKAGSVLISVSIPASTVASVQVNLSAPTLSQGASGVATAVAYDAQGNIVSGNPVTWLANNTAVVTVNAAGQYTGVAPGSTSVRATVSGVNGLATVVVSSNTPPPPPGPVQLPALPQVYLNTPYPALTGHSTYVAAGGNLQQAINAANRGDEIVLQAGATFTGNFTLPAKSGTVANGWIVIRSEKLNQLPPEGTRVTSVHAPLMAKIVTPSVAPAFATALSASGYRLAGLEITVVPTLTALQYGLVSLGDGSNAQNSLALVATDLVVDRTWIHGSATQEVVRCIALNSARTVISDSYLTDCHAKGFDSQAIMGWNGPGPYKIVNNTLEGATENIMFGGSDPAIANLIPSDIEIRQNYFYSPAAWKGVWTKKNLFESKNSRRVLLEGNVLDGSWLDAQVGFGVFIKSTNQNGGCSWCSTTDLTMRYNRVTNVAGAFALHGYEASNPNYVANRSSRILVEHNIVDNVNVGVYTGVARLFQLGDSVVDVTLRNNTMTSTGVLNSFISLTSTTSVMNFSFRDNITSPGQYGLFGTAVGEGSPALGLVLGTIDWSNAVIISASRTGYPAGTVWAASLAAAQAIPGAGANTAQVNALTAGVIIP